MRHFIRTITIAALALAGCGQNQVSDTQYVKYVDTKIGTGGHGHVFVGANVPFGLVQLGPTSIPQTWDWTSGYGHRIFTHTSQRNRNRRPVRHHRNAGDR